ncbi:MAG: hypothetical protein WCY19_06675 [Candidatus Gastranaerophilaceae bacterium]
MQIQKTKHQPSFGAKFGNISGLKNLMITWENPDKFIKSVEDIAQKIVDIQIEKKHPIVDIIGGTRREVLKVIVHHPDDNDVIQVYSGDFEGEFPLNKFPKNLSSIIKHLLKYFPDDIPQKIKYIDKLEQIKNNINAS